MSKTRGNVIDPLEVIEGIPIEPLVKKIQESLLSKAEQDRSIKLLKQNLPEGIP